MITPEQLQPIVLPEPVKWWPPAPGWWLLAATLLIAIVLWRYVKHRRLQGQKHPLL